MTRNVAVPLVLLLFLFVGLWSVGYLYSLAKSKLSSFNPIGGGWEHPRMYSFKFVDGGMVKGKVRVGEQVTVARLGIQLIYMNSTLLDRIELTFRILLNRETDYPNRSRAIIIKSSHEYHWSGETWGTKLNKVFNETLKFGDQITQIDPGQELRLKSSWELDEILFYKNQSVKTMSAAFGGGSTEIIVENLQNPMLTYFLENVAEGMGQAGTVVTLVASAVILWKTKKKSVGDTK